MAKRKDSVALFEVITATKRKAAAAAVAASAEPRQRASKWWFKGNARPADSVARDGASDPNDPTAGAVLPSTFAPAQLARPIAAMPTQSIVSAESPAAPAVVQRVLPASYAAPVVRVGNSTSQSATVDIPATAERPRRPWFGGGIKKLGLDRDRKEVTLRFRYTTAIIVGFAMVVAIGLAYATGRRTKPAVAGPNSPSSDEIRRGDVLAHVLDIGSDRVTTIDTPASPPQTEVEPGPRPLAPPKEPAGVKPPVIKKGNSDVEVGTPRILGLNYVIIQVYPDRTDAEAAKNFLVAAGIPCTVERVPEGWAANPELWSVIGIHGFTRPKSMPEYKDYVASIMKASESHVGKSNRKRFQPSARKWQ